VPVCLRADVPPSPFSDLKTDKERAQYLFIKHRNYIVKLFTTSDSAHAVRVRHCVTKPGPFSHAELMEVHTKSIDASMYTSSEAKHVPLAQLWLTCHELRWPVHKAVFLRESISPLMYQLNNLVRELHKLYTASMTLPPLVPMSTSTSTSSSSSASAPSPLPPAARTLSAPPAMAVFQGLSAASSSSSSSSAASPRHAAPTLPVWAFSNATMAQRLASTSAAAADAAEATLARLTAAKAEQQAQRHGAGSTLLTQLQWPANGGVV
jgi:hypothetical protein